MTQAPDMPPESPDARDMRAELARLLKAKIASAATYPLSPAQLAIWFHQRMDPDSSS
jgi:hypothetical protein